MTECAADVVVGWEKEYGNSFSIAVKEWGKLAVDCLDIVADVSKSKKLVESGGYRTVRCVVDKEA